MIIIYNENKKNIQENIYTEIQQQIIEMHENAKLSKTQKTWFRVCKQSIIYCHLQRC